MQNDYALLQPDTVLAIGKHIEAMDELSRDGVRQNLRVGVGSVHYRAGSSTGAGSVQLSIATNTE